MRNRIYELILGGHTIHIDSKAIYQREFAVYGLSHHLCLETQSEEDVQNCFDTSSDCWYAVETIDRHENCRDGNKLDSSLLHSCRQIYNEANLIRYSSNTFSFRSDRFSHLNKFCQQTPSRYKSVIRSAHLYFDIQEAGYDIDVNFNLQGRNELLRRISNHMRGLQRLYINIEFWPWPNRISEFEFQVPTESHFLKSISQYAKLDLATVTVTVCDYKYYENEGFGINNMCPYRWTLAQKQEWSQCLRNQLLSQRRQNVLGGMKAWRN